MPVERRDPAVCNDSNKKEGKGEMTKAPICLQDLRRSLYVKAKAEPTGASADCTFMSARYLDQFVWDQIIGLLNNGTLIQAEIDRRKEVARNTDPRRQRSEALRREQARLGNNVARLITAYQESLVSLTQLRQRMPELNKKSQAVESELQSLETAAVDQARYLQLAVNCRPHPQESRGRRGTNSSSHTLAVHRQIPTASCAMLLVVDR